MWDRRQLRGFGLVTIVIAATLAPWASADEARIEALLEQMTVREKVGQMTQLTIQAVSSREGAPGVEHELDPEKLRQAVVDYGVGSLLNVWNASYTREHWVEVISAIQDLATKETRLGIPVLYGIDAVHGHHYMTEGTVFPQNLALAATWNADLVREANRITAVEARASGIPWNFSPVLDLGRQPLWSRFFETFGEDVHLATVLGRAAVEGLQGDDIGQPDRVAACGKHFLGYSYPFSGKDRTPAYIPERQLREYFLPTFRATIEDGLATIMVNSGEINGVPVHASRAILTDLLRDELGFEGLVVTDWEDVLKLRDVHRVAPSEKEAIRIAVEAGIDMSMTPYSLSFADLLIELVEEGTIPESRLDESVRRILTLKDELGLFDDAYPNMSLASKVGTEEAKEIALNAAREAVTLLRNEGDLLPIAEESKVLVTGPAATSLPMLFGSWSYTWQGQNIEAYPNEVRDKTLLESLRRRFGASQIVHVPGVEGDRIIDIGAAVDAAREADVVVLALGEEPTTEKPGDIEDLSLPQAQIRLARALTQTDTPIVLVLMENRPRIIRPIADQVDAIVMAYQLGTFGGEAIAEVLVGDVNPSGRLPFTYPRHVNSLFVYDHKYAERLNAAFGTAAFQPQFEFGTGLSYTEYAYSDLTLSAEAIDDDEDLTVQVTVTNTGDVAGQEVVQLYVSDLYASITPPVRRLRGFEKVDLEPGQSETVTFTLDHDALSFIGLENVPIVEPGAFRVQVGDQAAEFVVRD